MKWLLIIAVIKLALFVFFAIQFKLYAKEGLVTSNIVVEQADSQSYYNPSETFVQTGDYPGMCRMPGLTPIFSIYSFCFGKQAALVGVVITQWLFSVLSVLLLAIVASRLIAHKRAFPVVALLYALSSFVSIWDHTILSDSFSASFLIIALYFLTEFVIRNHWKYLLLAGFWLT
ncbi:MAG: glycosyltransferase family 39 protein, partial [Flavobacterium sp.]